MSGAAVVDVVAATVAVVEESAFVVVGGVESPHDAATSTRIKAVLRSMGREANADGRPVGRTGRMSAA